MQLFRHIALVALVILSVPVVAADKDMSPYGTTKVVPAGFAEIADLQAKGYQLIIPTVTAVKDSRYLDHPELKQAVK